MKDEDIASGETDQGTQGGRATGDAPGNPVTTDTIDTAEGKLGTTGRGVSSELKQAAGAGGEVNATPVDVSQDDTLVAEDGQGASGDLGSGPSPSSAAGV